MERALEVARVAVAKDYGFQDLAMAGKRDTIKQIAESALNVNVFDQPCIKGVLVAIFFEDNNSWGRKLGHYFENKFSLQVLALAVALVSRFVN